MNWVHILIAAPVKYVSSIYEAMLFLSFFLSFFPFLSCWCFVWVQEGTPFTLFFLVFDWTLHLFFFFLFFLGGGDLFALSSLFFFIFSQIFDLGTCRLLSKNQGIVEILLDPPLVVFVVFVLIKSARAFGYITIPRKCQHLLPWYRRSFLPPSSRWRGRTRHTQKPPPTATEEI